MYRLLLLPLLYMLALLVLGACRMPAYAQLYTVTDLGPYISPSSSIGRSVNASGQVTGSSGTTANNAHAFIWSPDTHQPNDLGSLGGKSNGASINASGYIVGFSTIGEIGNGTINDVPRGSLWSPYNPITKSFPLAELYSLVDVTPKNPYAVNYGDYFRNGSSATCINNAGWIVGSSDAIYNEIVQQPDKTYTYIYSSTSQSCYWKPGVYDHPYVLGGLATDRNTGVPLDTSALSINNHNQVVGSCYLYDSDDNATTHYHACIWNIDASSMSPSPTIIDKTIYPSAALGINDVRQVVGTRVGSACVWSRSADGNTWNRQDLDVKGQFRFSVGTSINNSGQVVGYDSKDLTNNSYRPFLWSPSTGKMKDLNTLIDPASGWTLLYAYSISDTGYITGFGLYNGFAHAFLLRPVVWGANARLTKKDANAPPILDNLVALEDRRLTLLSGLSFSDTGTIVIDHDVDISLDDVASIEVLPDNQAGTPGSGSTVPGFNKYNIQPGVGAGIPPVPKPATPNGAKTVVDIGHIPVQATPNTAYTNGQWNFVFYRHYKASKQHPIARFERYSIPVPDRSSLRFQAIPRISGDVNENVRPYLNVAADSISLPNLGLDKGRIIPKQIMYAIAREESGNLHQCGTFPIWTGSSTNVANISDPSGYEKTKVTIDGGVGIMQITGDAANQTLPPPDGDDAQDHLLTHIYYISASAQYNIEAGAYLLAHYKWNDKRNLFNAAKFPNYIEHWYVPVSLYNGGIDEGYAVRVWNRIKNPDPTDLPNVSPIADTVAKDYFKYHLTTRNDGLVQIVLNALSLAPTKTGFSVQLDANENIADVTISSIGIKISNGAVSLPSNGGFLMLQRDGNQFTGEIPGLMTKGSRIFTVTLEVTVEGRLYDCVFSYHL